MIKIQTAHKVPSCRCTIFTQFHVKLLSDAKNQSRQETEDEWSSIICVIHNLYLIQSISFNSSVGRASDWRSEGHVFDSHLKHSIFCYNILRNIICPNTYVFWSPSTIYILLLILWGNLLITLFSTKFLSYLSNSCLLLRFHQLVNLSLPHSPYMPIFAWSNALCTLQSIH